MPIYVTRTLADGRTLADCDTLAKLTGYSAATIRIYCRPDRYDRPGDPDLYDQTDPARHHTATGRALYHQQTVVAELEARGCQPRPDLQGRKRARKNGPAKRRRKPR